MAQRPFLEVFLSPRFHYITESGLLRIFSITDHELGLGCCREHPGERISNRSGACPLHSLRNSYFSLGIIPNGLAGQEKEKISCCISGRRG
jgi:hypothetical protein